MESLLEERDPALYWMYEDGDFFFLVAPLFLSLFSGGCVDMVPFQNRTVEAGGVAGNEWKRKRIVCWPDSGHGGGITKDRLIEFLWLAIWIEVEYL